MLKAVHPLKMSKRTLANPPVRLSRISKLIIFTFTTSYISYKSFQYLSQSRPDLLHELYWKRTCSKYFEGKLKPNAQANLSGLHSFAIKILHYGLFPKVNIDYKGVDMTVKYGEYTFKNPLGVAAGIPIRSFIIETYINKLNLVVFY